MPGENFRLNLEAVDELRQDVITLLRLSNVNPINGSSKILLDKSFYVSLPSVPVRFSFSVPEAIYNEIGNKEVRVQQTLRFTDPYSSLKNDHIFYLEIQKCRPGFVFSREHKNCVCDTKRDGIER